MIDKLDLRVPRDVPFRNAVNDFTRGLPYETYTTRVRPGVHYVGKSDLRQIGIDALLHLFCKHGEHNHKLEVLDVGEKSYSETSAVIESVFDVDPSGLEVMRVDAAADIPDLPVSWFQQNTRVKYKRLGIEHGEGKYQEIKKGEIQTITAGKRPNLIRIYNKTEERVMQYNRIAKTARKNKLEPPTFEAAFGHSVKDMVTRVERQCGGDRIPAELGTFGKIRNATDFNPFSPITIRRASSKRLPTIHERPGIEYFTGIGLHEEWKRLGMQAFLKKLNATTHGNGARVIRHYSDFLPDESENDFDSGKIFEIYRQSLKKQLAA